MRAVMSLVVLALCAAATPPELTHQGRVLDAGGTPIEGQHDLTVELFAAPTGGSAGGATTRLGGVGGTGSVSRVPVDAASVSGTSTPAPITNVGKAAFPVNVLVLR